MAKDGKQKIIEAAQRLITTHGVEKTSMRDIAEEAGMTTGAIYHYYKSKEDLLYDVMDFTTAVTSEIMKLRAKPHANPDDVLNEIARRVAHQMKNNKNWNLRFYLSGEAAQGNETLRNRFASNYAAQTQRTADLFNYVFDTESQPEDLALAVLMVAALDGINFQQFVGALPVDIDVVTRIYNEFFAYAVPRFQRELNEINRFENVEMDNH